MTDMNDVEGLLIKARRAFFVLNNLSVLEPPVIGSDEVVIPLFIEGINKGEAVSIVGECGKAAVTIYELITTLEQIQSKTIA